MLLEELIAFYNGRYKIPINRFSAEEFSRATNGFCSDPIEREKNLYKMYNIYEGTFEERLIFIEKYEDCVLDSSKVRFNAIRDLVMMVIMGSHKDVVKLSGCCQDFKIPAFVSEYAAGSIEFTGLLHENRSNRNGEEYPSVLPWKTRRKIGSEIANAVVYMHTAFPTPIIHRDLNPTNVIIVQGCCVAKLLDFSFTVSIPPGETQVKLDDVIGSGTYGFPDPEYVKTSFVTEKSDVYCFGMILLLLLTGKRAVDPGRVNHHQLLNDPLNNVVDPRILQGERGGGGRGMHEQEQQQFGAFAALALRCLQENRENRPEMIDVAKELRRMLRSVCLSSLSQQ